jgi:signal transduction histidine kinase
MLAPALSEWDEAASAVAELAVAGEGSAASELLVSSLVPAAERLGGAATTERDERAATVADAQNRVGRVAQLAGFLTALLLPLGAIIAYRFSVHRQLDVAEAHLDARLEVEKSMGRAKDEFMVNVSRELRTPLASIYGFSEELIAQGFVDPTAGDLVGLINSESADLARTAEDLLVAAHNTDAPLPLAAAPVAMADEINAVLDPFRRRGHIIGGNFGPGTVVGDQFRIRQILGNLVANAFEHGGPTVRVYGDVAGNNYVVSVEDDGEGIPEHIESRLFSRFVHQGDEPLTTGSAGLGLAVAHLLAEAMGGTLEYDKVVGRTSLVLSLPIA